MVRTSNVDRERTSSGSRKSHPPSFKKALGSSAMVFMIFTQFKDWIPSVKWRSLLSSQDCGGRGGETLLNPFFREKKTQTRRGMYLDMLEEVHGNGRDQHGFSVVVLEDKDHVEILDVELHAFEVDQLHLVESDDERRPFGEVHETSAGRLKLASRTEWNAGEAELLERRVKVHIALGDTLHFLREGLERRGQSRSKLALSLETESWTPWIVSLTRKQTKNK